MSKTRPAAFTLVIDQDIDKLLNVLVQLAMGNPDFAGTLIHHKLKDAFALFGQRMIEGTSLVEWCNVDDCNGGDCEHREEV